jgi:hypothetical protein
MPVSMKMVTLASCHGCPQAEQFESHNLEGATIKWVKVLHTADKKVQID